MTSRRIDGPQLNSPDDYFALGGVTSISCVIDLPEQRAGTGVGRGSVPVPDGRTWTVTVTPDAPWTPDHVKHRLPTHDALVQLRRDP